MRKITSHQVNGCNKQLEIEVLDEPGQGGASHLYRITGFDSETNPSCPCQKKYGYSPNISTILFQNGPVNEDGVGVNGITQEALLAIVIDRLESFQQGPYKCIENAMALDRCKEAVDCLNQRTANRVERGVEGTHEV